MLGFQQGIFQANIEIVVVHVMQKHVDTTEVVGGGIDLLAKILQIGILFAYGLGKLKQQRSATTGGVINLIDIGIMP